MRCNNRDDLLQLSLTLKTSIFSEAFGTRKIPPWSIPSPPSKLPSGEFPPGQIPWP